MAEVRGIDLGLGANTIAPVQVQGRCASLLLLLGKLANAIHSTPSRGGVDVEVYTEGSHAFVVVNDADSGISALNRHWVFDRFYRHEGGSTVGGGVGLASVLSLARQHGDFDTPCGCTRMLRNSARAARHWTPDE